MLETLDTIPWQTLRHAYGEASDIPGLIRDLASAQKTVRQAAQSRLGCTVYHQGTVYSSTACIVPFCCELLEDEHVEDKIWLLDFLVTIAHGSSYVDVHVRNNEVRHTPAFQCDLAQELSWVQASKEAVSNGYSTYLHLLAAESVEIRAYAAYALACCQSNAEQITPTLRKSLTREPGPLVRASILLSLGQLLPSSEQSHAFFTQMLNAQTQPVVQIAAAIASAFMAKEATPPEVVQILLQAYEQPQSVGEEFGRLPFAQVDLDACLSNAFRCIGLSVAPLVVPTLIHALKRSNAWSGLDLVHNLLSLALEDTIISHDMTEADLTDLQREVLLALVESEQVWGLGNMQFTVGRFFAPRYGLDFSLRSREDVAAFLSGKEPTRVPLTQTRMRLPDFIEQLRTTLELTPRQAMDLLHVRSLSNLDLQEALEQLRHLVLGSKQEDHRIP